MFGMGFTEILIIVIIAILFLGPDKLPSAMVDIAKFFRQMKTTIGTMKESIEEEMNVSEIKNEALAYKKQLMDAHHEFEKVADPSFIEDTISNYADELVKEDEKNPKAIQEEVTFKKKKKSDKKPQTQEDDIDV